MTKDDDRVINLEGLRSDLYIALKSRPYMARCSDIGLLLKTMVIYITTKEKITYRVKE